MAAYSVIAISAAVALGSVAGIAGAAGNAGSMPRGSDDFPASDVISLLGGSSKVQARGITDVPPNEVLVAQGVDGIDPSNVRFLGEGAGARFWAAVDNAGNVCVVTRLMAQDVYASGCNTPESVEKKGVSIGAFGNPQEPGHLDVTALLLPDSAAVSGATRTRSDSPWLAIAPNLVVTETDRIQPGKTYEFDRRADRGKPVKFVND